MRRRGFLRTAAATGFAGLAAGRGETTPSGEGPRATVASVPSGTGVPAIAVSLDAGIDALGTAWPRLFRAEDRVAIKLNCLGGPRLSPRPEMVDALVERIRRGGVAAENIVLFDRTSEELERAGFAIHETGSGRVRCFGTDALEGGGYGRGIAEHRSIASFVTRIVAEFATALVSVGIAKDHDLSGVSGACKNLYGLIHNPNRYHDNHCDPYLADLCGHPAIAPKLRLAIVDAARAQCHGGPAFHPSYAFEPGRVLLGVDPIAVDRILADMIDAERRARGLPELAREDREPTWLETAERLGYGVAARARIRLIEA